MIREGSQFAPRASDSRKSAGASWPVLCLEMLEHYLACVRVQLRHVGLINEDCFVDVKCESFILNISGITKSSLS